jgi:carboxylate-amine ligase
VEEEFLLINPKTGEPLPIAEDALDRTGLPEDSLSDSLLTLELQQEQLEAVSRPCSTLDELAAAVLRGRSLADQAAQSMGGRAVALATSPFATTPTTVPRLRYLRMASRFGVTLTEQLTCGFHVHVFVNSGEEGVAVLDRIRVWLPLVLALSANSPFWHGADSGYESFRYQAWTRWPTAGPSEPFGSEEAYREHISCLLQSGVLLDQGMVYFDARLSDAHPTVEVRIADVCMNPGHATAIAAIVRALVEQAATDWQAGIPAPTASADSLRLASWRASKSGVQELLLHPLLNVPCPAAEAIDALLTYIRPALIHLGDEEYVKAELESILTHGTGSRRQRQTLAATNRLKSVVLDAVDKTHSVMAPILTLPTALPQTYSVPAALGRPMSTTPTQKSGRSVPNPTGA